MLTPLLYEVLSLFYSKEFVFGVFSGILHLPLTRQIVRIELCNLIPLSLLIVGRHFFHFLLSAL